MRAFFLLILVGCSEPAADAPAPASAPIRPPTSAPPVAAAPAEGATEGSEATRRTRFEQRPVIPPLHAWSASWKGMIGSLDGRLLKAATEVRTRASGDPWVTEITMSFRMFGQDAEVEKQVLQALKIRGFTGEALPETAVDLGTGRWHVEVARLKGEAPRETQFDLVWQQEPVGTDNQAPCKRPEAVPLPAEAPGWLNEVTSTRSTRRRVLSWIEVEPGQQALELTMLFQNGYAQDEAIGHYTELAKRRGFQLADGSGLKQTWKHADGSVLSWRPSRRELDLGCTVAGPIIDISWRAKS